MKKLRFFSPVAYFDPGILDNWQKNYDQAAAELKKVIKTKPNCVDAHYCLAAVCRALGKEKLPREDTKKGAQIYTRTRDNLLLEISGPAHAAFTR